MYPINEIFESIQGEGYFTGVPAVFVRLQGCPVECAWCDTQHSWSLDPQHLRPFAQICHKAGENADFAEQTAEQLLAYITHHFNAKHIVITGGEPCQYDLQPLCALFEAHGFACQIETSGTFAIQATARTWVTVSPKIGMRGKREIELTALMRANEIKHPVATISDINALDNLLQQIDIKHKIICLQPISQKPRATALCVETCIARNWRLSVQTHKYLAIA